MHTSLYAKFLGKVLPLDQAKFALIDTWRVLGGLRWPISQTVSTTFVVNLRRCKTDSYGRDRG